MKRYGLLAAFLFMVNITVYPALLIVKKEDGVFAPLAEADKDNSEKVATILIKYEWPMCIASNLTAKDQNALLTPDKAFAEESFIQNKLQETVSKDYFTVFVPTALYELFCIAHYLKSKGSQLMDPLRDAGNKLEDMPILNLLPLLNEKVNPQSIRQQIFEQYKKINALFFDAKENAAFYVNTLFGRWLLDNHSVLKDSTDSLGFSHAVKDKIDILVHSLMSEIKDIYQISAGNPSSQLTEAEEEEEENMAGLISAFEKDPQDKLVLRVIALEYEAREANKALLLRYFMC